MEKIIIRVKENLPFEEKKNKREKKYCVRTLSLVENNHLDRPWKTQGFLTEFSNVGIHKIF